MNLIFVHIQKTGGSSIVTAIGQSLHSPHKHRFAAELKPIHGAAAWDAAYKFAFVRNPWDRLVSWWSMIEVVRSQHEQGRFFNNFFKYILDSSRDFEEFIVNCRDDIEDGNGRKCIFRNQLDYVTDDNGASMVDFVGRFENLDEDFNRVLANAGCDGRSLPHYNPTKHQPYQEYYSPRTRSIVEEAYARDIAHFGYQFEP